MPSANPVPLRSFFPTSRSQHQTTLTLNLGHMPSARKLAQTYTQKPLKIQRVSRCGTTTTVPPPLPPHTYESPALIPSQIHPTGLCSTAAALLKGKTVSQGASSAGATARGTHIFRRPFASSFRRAALSRGYELSDELARSIPKKSSQITLSSSNAHRRSSDTDITAA